MQGSDSCSPPARTVSKASNKADVLRGTTVTHSLSIALESLLLQRLSPIFRYIIQSIVMESSDAATDAANAGAASAATTAANNRATSSAISIDPATTGLAFYGKPFFPSDQKLLDDHGDFDYVRFRLPPSLKLALDGIIQQCLQFPVKADDFESFLQNLGSEVSKKTGDGIAPIETIAIATTPRTVVDSYKFFSNQSLFSNLKKLFISCDGRSPFDEELQAPLEGLTDLLRNAPLLDSVDVHDVRLGRSHSDYAMFRFCDVLRRHPSLCSFTFQPALEAAPGSTEEDVKLAFAVNPFLQALAETPNLRKFRFRPSFRCVEMDYDLNSTQNVYGGADVVLITSLARLFGAPSLSCLEIDFRSERQDALDMRNFKLQVLATLEERQLLREAVASSNLSTFTYRHGSDYERMDDGPIIVDILQGVKNNSILRHLDIEQLKTTQLPGVLKAIADAVATNSALESLRLPNLNVNMNVDAGSLDDEFQCLASAVKQNRTLQELDLRANSVHFSTKSIFKDVLTSKPFTESNTSLVSLVLAYKDDDAGDDDDSRTSASYMSDDDYVPEVDVALCLNRAGRAKLVEKESVTSKEDLVSVLLKIPGACDQNTDVYETYIRKHTAFDITDMLFHDGAFLQRTMLTSLKDRDIVCANYYCLRTFLNAWAPPPVAKTEAPNKILCPSPKKKAKRSHAMEE